MAIRRMLGLMFVGLLLQGCGLPIGGLPVGGKATIKEAAAEAVADRGPMRIQAVTSPEVLITRQIPAGVIALFTYDAVQNGVPQKVTATWLFKRRGLGWMGAGGGSGGRPANEPPQPVDFGWSSGTDSDGTSYAAASGLVADPAVRLVAVVFDDGSREVVTVERGAYLAVKQGNQGVAKIEALGADGRVLHSSTLGARPAMPVAPPPPAPTVSAGSLRFKFISIVRAGPIQAPGSGTKLAFCCGSNHPGMRAVIR
jgi:hypothetical protein